MKGQETCALDAKARLSLVKYSQHTIKLKCDTMKQIKIKGLRLVKGPGNYEEGRACVMSAAAAIHGLEQGEPLKEATDYLACACPVLRQLIMYRNDNFKHDDERTAWGIDLIPRIIGSRRGRDEMVKRAQLCAQAARQISDARHTGSGLSARYATRAEVAADRAAATGSIDAAEYTATYAGTVAAECASWEKIDELIERFLAPEPEPKLKAARLNVVLLGMPV